MCFSCENDDGTFLNPKINEEDFGERLKTDPLSSDNIQTEGQNSEFNSSSEKRDLLNLDFKYYISSASTSTMNNNNLVLRNMYIMTDETRHFLASPLALANAETEYFQRKMTSTSSPLTINSTSVNNVNSPTNNATTAGDNNNSISTTANHIIQNAITQNINSLNNKVTLNQVNHTPKARPHTCEECGKAFMLKHHLLTHMRVHTGERPHVCPECGKTFALKHCLSTHMLLHTAERPYKCVECNKTFTLKHHLVSVEVLICISFKFI